MSEPRRGHPEPPVPPYLHITCPSGLMHEATVKLVGEDGTEVPIMPCVRSVTVNIGPSDPWVTATVVFEGVQIDTTAAPAELDKTRRAVELEHQWTTELLDSLKPCPDSPASPDA